jgi:rubrerythrin
MDKTIKNLAKAFIGESQARNRYAIYAKIAKNEGYEQISAIFEETAEQEREHAKWLMRLIHDIAGEEIGEEIRVEAAVPTAIGKTEDNLRSAIAGENHEYTSMYPEFAEIANKEGYPEISGRLKAIAKAEAHHEERYKKILASMIDNKVFSKDEETAWICRKCGYEHKGNKSPEICPSCAHPRAYFQVKSEAY